MRALPEDLAHLFDFDPATLRVGSKEGKHREFKRQANNFTATVSYEGNKLRKVLYEPQR